MPRYNPAEIEPKWQRFWDEHKTFATPAMPAGEKLYTLDMFPYPSGDGLHVGHPEGYTATDIVSRFERMRGKTVLHPMGFDAFGLPAEEHAIKTNTPPRASTEKNIATFTRQLKMLGFSYDWDRVLATTDVGYFRWTQWIFLVLFDTWFDGEQQKGRPISELPVPDEVATEGDAAVAAFQDDHRLAFQSDALVNWCPALGTVLANEEVIDGKSERGNHPVERIPLKQWMLRITAYGDRLEKDLELVNWPESVKLLQRNWIGRSTGAEVDFFIGEDGDRIDGTPASGAFDTWQAARRASGFPLRNVGDDVLRVYTTRPDTLYGATYMVVAPEHPFVERLTTPPQTDAVKAYCDQAAAKSDMERTELAKKKTGVFSGSSAINPVNGNAVPIWIADYVLISYGTGAIMAVPAHDERDFEFAEEFRIPIVPVVDPGEDGSVDRAKVMEGQQVFSGDGIAANSGDYEGLPTPEFKTKITSDLATSGIARSAVNYKLRDWLFARQRFWGEPFPILHELDEQGKKTGRIRAVDPQDLPVDLPKLDDFKPHGRPEPPLDKAPDDWLFVEIDGKRYKRETNTMPQWAGSCWYYLRFIDAKNDEVFIDAEKEKAWMPIDLYVGGAEHAVLHLLYSRFWHKVLYDRGHVSTPEPFHRLVNQGMILGEVEITGYKNADGTWVSTSEVRTDVDGKHVTKTDGAGVSRVSVDPEDAEKQGEFFVLAAAPEIKLDSRAFKMSKSRGNVVNPDDIVREYGADSLRLYEMFMGPLEATKPWSMDGVGGVRNFLDRFWKLIIDPRAEGMQLNANVEDVQLDEEQNRVLHRTIRGVTQDFERLAFNTAIAKLMEFTNFFTKQTVRPKAALEQVVLLLSPLAPHFAEELWQALGHDQTLAYEPWPQYDEDAIREASIEIPVQIQGKVRSKVRVPNDVSRDDLEAAARADERIVELLDGKSIVKVVVVPGRLVNFVVK